MNSARTGTAHTNPHFWQRQYCTRVVSRLGTTEMFLPHFSHGGLMLLLSRMIRHDDALAQASASIGESPNAHSRTVDVGASRIIDVQE